MIIVKGTLVVSDKNQVDLYLDDDKVWKEIVKMFGGNRPPIVVRMKHEMPEFVDDMITARRE